MAERALFSYKVPPSGRADGVTAQQPAAIPICTIRGRPRSRQPERAASTSVDAARHAVERSRGVSWNAAQNDPSPSEGSANTSAPPAASRAFLLEPPSPTGAARSDRRDFDHRHWNAVAARRVSGARFAGGLRAGRPHAAQLIERSPRHRTPLRCSLPPRHINRQHPDLATSVVFNDDPPVAGRHGEGRTTQLRTAARRPALPA